MIRLIALCLIGAATLVPSAARADERNRPNVIFMFADDQARNQHNNADLLTQPVLS